MNPVPGPLPPAAGPVLDALAAVLLDLARKDLAGELGRPAPSTTEPAGPRLHEPPAQRRRKPGPGKRRPKTPPAAPNHHQEKS